MLKQRLAGIRRKWRRWFHRREFEREIEPRLPEDLRSAARFVFDGVASAEEQRISAQIESFRQRIKEVAGVSMLSSHPSPKPATFQQDAQGRAVAAPLRTSAIEDHMKTGASPASGLLLRRLAMGTKASRILELGTNTGFSGCYFLSSPLCRELVTIEGSAELCAIAKQNLSRISDNFSVLSMYFDDAIDEISRGENKFDCAYIDGQHEREATLHYGARVCGLLREGGCLIFDDIRWSQDMNDAWQEIRRDARYRMTVDLGSKGVCILGGGGSQPEFIDVSRVLGKVGIRNTSR